MLNSVFRSVTWLTLEHLVKMLVALVVSPLIARKLGVEDYGSFQYGLSLTALFMSISYVCGNEVLVPRLVRSTAARQTDEILATAFVLRSVFSALAYVLLIAFSLLAGDDGLFSLVLVLGISILLAEPFAAIIAWLYAKGNGKPKSIVGIIASTTKLTVIAALFFADVESKLFYAIPFAIESIFIAVSLAFIYTGYEKRYLSYSVNLAKDLLKSGFPFFLGALFMGVFQRSDMIFLNSLSSGYELSIYSSAWQIFTSINILGSIIAISFAPKYIFDNKDSVELKKIVIYFSISMLFISLVIAVLSKSVMPYIIPALFGDEFYPSVSVIGILSFVSVLVFVGEGLNQFYFAKNLGGFVVIKWLVSIFSVIPFYFFLVPGYGAVGAAISLALGYFIGLMWYVYKFIAYDG